MVGSLEIQQRADRSESSEQEQNGSWCLPRDEVLAAVHHCQLPKRAFFLLMPFPQKYSNVLQVTTCTRVRGRGTEESR